MPRKTPELLELYHALLDYFGPQHWWPGDSPFEVLVGAVLTQNTNWNNVERAIDRLKERNLLSPYAIHNAGFLELAETIRPAGYYNIKAKRLKNLVRWLVEEYNADLDALADLSLPRLREDLLAVNGIGRETADSILLYALHRQIFVVDAYTFRVLTRHRLLDPDADYDLIQDYCQSHLPADTQLYNECHALLVAVGKHHCRPRPRCDGCPLEPFPHDTPE